MFLFDINVNQPTYGTDRILRDLATLGELAPQAERYIVERNGAICTGVKQVVSAYSGKGPIPITTQRKVPIEKAIREFIGYLRGYTTVEQFQSIGVNTWNKDANKNQSWLDNPNRKGHNDIGEIYGAYVRKLVGPDGKVKDLIREQLEMLRAGKYNRRNIINWYDPFVRGALPACMYEHAFTVHKGSLNITSKQRSQDASTGGEYNRVQCYFFMHLVAKLCGYEPGDILHVVDDFHIYDNQREVIAEFTSNPVKPSTARLVLGPRINKDLSFDELDTMPIEDIFAVEGYQSHGVYSIPITV